MRRTWCALWSAVLLSSLLAACGGGSSTASSPTAQVSATRERALAVTPPSGITSGANYKLINPNSGSALDLIGCGTADGTLVELWADNGTGGCNGGTNQIWSPRLNSDGTFNLVNPVSGKALDVAGCGTANGTTLGLWDNGVNVCQGGAGQKWAISANSDGSYTLVNPNSGGAVDIAGCGTANGTKVALWSAGVNVCNGGAGQHWKFVLVSTSTIPTSDTPDFGANVQIFDSTMSAATIQGALDSVFNSELLSSTAQFGNERTAFLFKPGNYGVTARLGFYESVQGLGQNPGDVQLNGGVTVDSGWNLGDQTNATQNFWRSVENLAIVPGGGTTEWAVSQAAPMRRVHIIGNLHMGPTNQGTGQGYSSGATSPTAVSTRSCPPARSSSGTHAIRTWASGTTVSGTRCSRVSSAPRRSLSRLRRTRPSPPRRSRAKSHTSTSTRPANTACSYPRCAPTLRALPGTSALQHRARRSR